MNTVKRVRAAAQRDRDRRKRLEMAEHVWDRLVELVGCASPDGSAEIGQVEFYRDEMHRGYARARQLAAVLQANGIAIPEVP